MGKSSNIDWENVTAFALIGVGVYVAHQILTAAKKVGEKTVDVASDAIAWPIIQVKSWFWNEPKIPGYMLLPDNRAIPLTQTHVDKVPGREQYVFTFESRRYEVIGRTDTGNYVARNL